MNEVINFNYEGNEIPFKVDENGEVFINATAMLKPFSGKRMHNFTRNKTTLEFINTLHEEMGETPVSVSSDSKLINVTWEEKAKLPGSMKILHWNSPDG